MPLPPYPGVDSFPAAISIPDDADLVHPSVAVLAPPWTAHQDGLVYLKNRIGGSRVKAFYGNPIGSLGFANVWSDTSGIVAADPTYVQLVGSGALLAGGVLPLVGGDTLDIELNLTAQSPAVTGAALQFGIGIGMNLNGGGYNVLPMSELYTPYQQNFSSGVIEPNSAGLSMRAIVVGDIATSFNFAVMGTVVGLTGASCRIQLRGSGSIRVVHYSVNP